MTKILPATILRFLDQEREQLGAMVADQEGDWLERHQEIEIFEHQMRWNAFARIIRDRAAAWADGALEIKAQALAQALETTDVPDFHYIKSGTLVESVWHRSVRGEKPGASGRKAASVQLGMVDYVMKVSIHRLELDDAEFGINIGADACPVAFDDRPGRSPRDEFLLWLEQASVEACRASAGKTWKVRGAGSVELCVFAVPAIRDVSALIKKLRRYTEALPGGTVYVCTADEEEADTLHKQGIGTLVFPTGTTRGWRMAEGRNSLQDAHVDFQFQAAWAQAGGAPRPGAA